MSVLASLLYEQWQTIDRYGSLVENELTGIHIATTLGWELHVAIEEAIGSEQESFAEIHLTLEQAKLVAEKINAFIAMRENQKVGI